MFVHRPPSLTHLSKVWLQGIHISPLTPPPMPKALGAQGIVRACTGLRRFKNTAQESNNGRWKATGRAWGKFLWNILYKTPEIKGVRGEHMTPMILRIVDRLFPTVFPLFLPLKDLPNTPHSTSKTPPNKTKIPRN